MKPIETLDIIVGNTNSYHDAIIKTYPKQQVFLALKEDDGIYVESIYGCLGKLFPEDETEIIDYLKNSEQYFIDAHIKKTYCKDKIYEGVVLLIQIYEKGQNFVVPRYDFVGNYISNYTEYDFTSIDEIKCAVKNQNSKITQDIIDYDNAKLIIAHQEVKVYFYSSLVGNLSKKKSEKIIPYLKDEHIDVIAHFEVREDSDEEEIMLNVIVEITRKAYLEYNKCLKNKSLLIDGVDVVRKVRKENFIHYYKVEDKDLNCLPEEIETFKANKAEEIKKPTDSDKEETPKNSLQTNLGCYGSIIISIFFLGYVIYSIVNNQNISNGAMIMIIVFVFVFGVMAMRGSRADSIQILEKKHGIKGDELVYIGVYAYGNLKADMTEFKKTFDTLKKGENLEIDFQELSVSSLKEADIYAFVDDEYLKLFYSIKNNVEVYFLNETKLIDIGTITLHDNVSTDDKYKGSIGIPIGGNISYIHPIFSNKKTEKRWIEITWHKDGIAQHLLCIVKNKYIYKDIENKLINKIHSIVHSEIEYETTFS
ncbi:hypothetical protein [Bergeyella zoohelcum]|uniref:Uncharacterized protein n=1 Tax=Bergeyella zoohelcum TaxID=1015 RepID=A0A380ZZG2_9FLAO|nr:hypothetical protein [Bergeyella zoohelcum]EKB60378.1 hypothetical protein HMPREF9700_01197 [Bergeyella zoohelcum CCUG 30536]SUV52940.1 Uncharacterised protein [Bergeyella zoohelcum]